MRENSATGKAEKTLSSSVAETSAVIDVDRPLSDPHQDELGRADFADAIARLIASYHAPEGFVIALCSPWGSGKSTLLNFVEVSLREAPGIPDDRRPLVVRFNPWWFSGSEHLLHQFLNVFTLTLSGDRRLSRVMRDLGAYAESLEPLASLVPWGGPLIARALAAIRLITRPSRSPDEIRSKIDAELRRASRQILVMIDDIDRLPADEIRQMLKVVKSVADFPKTIYLLAFDKAKVAGALSDNSGEPGEEYLRKIVQLEIDIPQPDPDVLRDLLNHGLQQVLGHAYGGGRDAEDWQHIYQDSARHILRTLRDIKRYLNALAITYPFVKGEVYDLDFVAVELLRIFTPNVYATARSNRERFAGGDSEWESAIGGGTPDERKLFYDGMLRPIPEPLQLPVRLILEYLFPKVRASYGGHSSSPRLNESWRVQRRACSPDVFPVYFQLAVPVGEISLARFREVCRLADNRKGFAEALQALADPAQRGEAPGSRLLSFLQRLADHPEEITGSAPERLNACIGALYDIGDLVYRREWENLMVPSVDDAIVWAVEKLLGGGQDVSEYASWFMQLGRFERVRDAVASTASIYVPLLQVSRVAELNRRMQDTPQGQPAGPSRLPQSDKSIDVVQSLVSKPKATISPDRLDILKQLICERLDRASEDMTLAEAPRLLFILNKWEEWCASGDVKRRQFVQSLLKTEKGLARLLGEHVHMSVVERGPSDPGRVQYTVDLRQLATDLGDRNTMNSQYERATLMKLEGQPWVTRRIQAGVELFGEAWRRAGSTIPDVVDSSQRGTRKRTGSRTRIARSKPRSGKS